MTKQKITIVLAVVLVLVSIGILTFVILRNLSQDPGSVPQSENPFSLLGGEGPSSHKTLQIYTRSGEPVTTPDFIASHEPLETPGGKFYNLYGPEYSTEGFTFSLQYSEADSQFLINLLTEPIGNARKDGENYLRAILNVTSEQLCELNTVVSVNPDVSEVYSMYENLGLSFCPNAVLLP
tara:strand:- start:220100 stop:220639 length:540 start_codon:yes stop_codon:yes gene_type:complete